METTYLSLEGTRQHLRQLAMPKAVGQSHHCTPRYQKNFSTSKSKVVDFSSYRQTMTEEIEETWEEETAVVSRSIAKKPTWRDQVSFTLEFISTGAILATAVSLVVLFV